ncbi:pre-mRNA-splicing factor syf1 [Coemansia sp. RSA 552]|nr:pre-mRNA-splicing factor syf1 [Coemansia sp. RSA 552]
MDIDISPDDLRFEEEVQRSPFSVRVWQRYIEHKKAGDSKRATLVVFERAVGRLPGSYKLWRQYLKYRTDQLQGKNPLGHADEYRKAMLCFERSLLALHKMPVLWMEYCRLAARQPDVTVARRVFDRALRALPVTQHGRVWVQYLRFARAVGGVTAERVWGRYVRVWPAESMAFVEWCEATGRWAAGVRALVRELNAGRAGDGEWRRLARLVGAAGDIEGVDVGAVVRDGIGRAPAAAGELWAALGQHLVAAGRTEQARDVYEEALGAVRSLRDFALVFDAYAQMEEAAVADAMERAVQGAAAGSSRAWMELRLHQLERLMDRRALLASSVVLRQSPHAVDQWLKRVAVWRERAADEARGEAERRAAAASVVETFERAVSAVDPRRASGGRLADVWLAYAQHLAGNRTEMRAVLDRAVEAPAASVAELADLYVAYAEAELSAGDLDGALRVLTRATRTPAGVQRVEYGDESVPAAKRVFKSRRVWALLVDVQEAQGAVDATRLAYERMIELRIATAQTVVNFGTFLEEHGYFEDSFRAYERGISEFGYPVAVELWNVYLRRFGERYGGTQVERARDLYEQALEKCPPEYAKPLYVAYGRLEEEHGRARRSLRVYERATRAVGRGERLEMYRYYAAKTAELAGAAASRVVYEQGIEQLADSEALELSLEYARAERQLGEVDRARALYAYASQFADPRADPKLWTVWHEFEVAHGNEDSFREMLRVKRSVQARYNTDARFLAAAERETQKVRQEKRGAASAPQAVNPDEVAIDDDDL